MVTLDEKFERAVGKIFLNNRIEETIKDLCLLGSRFAGTESEKRAQKYISDFLDKIKVKPDEYCFEYQGWQRKQCRFTIQYNNVQDFPAISLVLSPSTSMKGVQGEIIDVGGGSQTEFEQKKEKVIGKIVMVNSGETVEGWLHRRIKYANAVKYGAKAFVFANHNPGQLFPTGSVRSNRIGEIPAIGISKESYEYIKELLNRNEELQGHIFIENKYQQTTSKHIIWEIPGEIEDEIIVIGGHYDGHDISQGATDNGGSIAVMLELTKLLKEAQIIPKRTLRFIAFGVEEFGVVGSTIYVNDSDLSDVVLMINLDGLVGHIPKMVTSNGNKELFEILQEFKEIVPYEYHLGTNIITASDNYPFLCKGIPNMCVYGLRKDPNEGRGWGHTSADTFDKIMSIDAKLSLYFSLIFLISFSSLKRMPKKQKKEKIIKMLQEAKLEEKLKLLEKWPVKDLENELFKR
ncbi:MAG: M28 family peptidase [Candidatus Heimdallarchaeaceae archaeon]